MLKLESINKNCEELLSQITDELHTTFMELSENSSLELEVNSEFIEKLGGIDKYYTYLNLIKLSKELEDYLYKIKGK